jgi:hypothetical protein
MQDFIQNIYIAKRAGGMVPMVEGLSSKCKTLNSNSLQPKKKNITGIIVEI